MTERFANCVCPGCSVDFGKIHIEPENDEGKITDDNQPKPGEALICPFCGLLSVFTNNMMLRYPTAKEAEFFADKLPDNLPKPLYDSSNDTVN